MGANPRATNQQWTVNPYHARLCPLNKPDVIATPEDEGERFVLA